MVDDNKAIMMLEKAIDEAKKRLYCQEDFDPFAFVLHHGGEITPFNQHCDDDTEEAYLILHDALSDYVKSHPSTDIVVLVTQATMPKAITQEDEIRSSIRIHLEEQSQQAKAIASRYLYIPYRWIIPHEETLSLELLTPQAISFPSEFFPKKR